MGEFRVYSLWCGSLRGVRIEGIVLNEYAGEVSRRKERIVFQF